MDIGKRKPWNHPYYISNCLVVIFAKMEFTL
jgi:hypothetical protein